jgi:hypothetical protein
MLVTGVERLPNNCVALKVAAFDPDADTEGPPIILVNESTPLLLTGSRRYGTARVPDVEPGWVAYDTSDGVPEFGEEWGLEDGEWTLKRDSDEQVFKIVGLPDVAKGRVLASYVLESGSDCPNNFRIVVTGNPTTGSFDLTLTLPGGDDTFSLDWDATRTDLQSAIEGHAHWSADYSVEVNDGPFPMTSLSFQLEGDLSGVFVAAPTVDNITLSGGARSGVRVERACCEDA